ncbi:small membrane A-kinase anchor protein isoform X1 [Ursus americanus]|uniref:small membrane A-kinase anchor protein isoform X1 n=1 Tax=Ursus americanus TaxID=9643 RepID=UPI001E67C8F2|nr:small membrane A-kinase anchor protein isoform X1 [Ursus americanus]
MPPRPRRRPEGRRAMCCVSEHLGGGRPASVSVGLGSSALPFGFFQWQKAGSRRRLEFKQRSRGQLPRIEPHVCLLTEEREPPPLPPGSEPQVKDTAYEPQFRSSSCLPEERLKIFR